MIQTNQMSPMTYAGRTTDLNFQWAPGISIRMLRVFYKLTLNSGGTPLIQAGLFSTFDTNFAGPFVQNAAVSASGAGVLTLEYPPPALYIRFDIGPVAQNWDIVFQPIITTIEG